MAEPWRWIDNPGGTHVLVEGDDLLPLAVTILTCGSIESSYQDRIALVPEHEEILRDVDCYFRALADWQGGDLGEHSAALHERVKAVLAKVPGA